MRFLRSLFGGRSCAPQLRIAPGQGYTFNIEGESLYQAALDRKCGGKREEGHRLKVSAELRIPNSPAEAIAVFIDGDRVGYMGGPDGAWLWHELVGFCADDRPIPCDALIVGVAPCWWRGALWRQAQPFRSWCGLRPRRGSGTGRLRRKREGGRRVPTHRNLA